MARAYVGLGSNLGDREQTLRAAVHELGALDGVEVVGLSSLRETAPVGYLDQPRFLNGVVVLETTLEPQDLLTSLLAVEAAFGRDRAASPPRGPRTLDLDLLVYGDRRVSLENLEIPHPRLHERAFVLEPLAEVEPGLEVPGMGAVEALLARVH